LQLLDNGRGRAGEAAGEGEDDGDEQGSHHQVTRLGPAQHEVLEADEDERTEHRPHQLPRACPYQKLCPPQEIWGSLLITRILT
jgi:hypothetical protein